MATFRKRGSAWYAEVCRQGVRRGASFDTKAEAQAWAVRTEAEILAGKRGEIPDKTFGQLLQRYADEVSPTKRGERWERMRLALIGRDVIADVRLVDLSSTHIAEWRDRRRRGGVDRLGNPVKPVSDESVRREMQLLSHACTVAVNEWRWLRESPISGVARPAKSPHRDRRISQDEIDRLCLATGYAPDRPLDTAMARVGAALLFAIETAMRAGEIVGLVWSRVDMDRRVARLEMTKNGLAREVPLSSEALRLLRQLAHVAVGESVFQLSSASLDALFRKARDRALIEGLTFHDSRHEAITRLAARLDVLELARMVGHRDLRMLMVYYNKTASELADKLG